VNPVIEVRALSRRFGKFLAVDNVSFHVEPGEIFGYLGANGAGKSTTIRMLTGLLWPSSGSATVAGFDIGEDPEGLKGAIGYMSQKFSLYLDLPVIENLLFFGGAYGLTGKSLRRKAAKALELTGLAESSSALTGALPGGLRQRLALSCALLHEPAIVFLDEPTAGVDPEARRAFWRVIRELARAGTTVFVTTHYLDEAEYCARIGLMVDGRLVALDTPEALKRTFVPERVFVAHGRALSQAGKLLQGEPGVSGVAAFGAGLHLRVDGALWGRERVRDFLLLNGAHEVNIEASEATLEDVFLEVVGRSAATKGQESL
jgi:ABC-2 type transport system ATP-binding protein